MEMQSNLETAPARLTAGEAIGLSDRGGQKWQRLRALQYSELARSRVIRISSVAIGALLCSPVYVNYLGVALVMGWLGILAAVIAISYFRTNTIFAPDRRRITESEFVQHNIALAVVAAIWAVPIVAIPMLNIHTHMIPVWIVTASLITCWSLLTPAMPLSAITFTGFSCGAGVIAGVLNGHYLIASCIAIFAAIAVFGIVEHACNFLSARIAQAGVSEKSEVVSLLLREFEENQADWLWQVDTSRRVRSVSPRFSYALGRTQEEVEGLPFLQLIAGENWRSGQLVPSMHDLADYLNRRESFSNLVVRVTINGENRWWELSGTPIIDHTGSYKGFRGVGSDVTEQRESDEKIAYLARYDTLTGLPNRLLLNETLRQALKSADQWRSRCAFLMLDLDRFKAVNDSLGHLVGDKLLAQVSERLKELTDENALCGRLGGDEFAVVIRDATNPELVDGMARKIIASLSQPFEINSHTLYVGASVGSALGPRDGTSVEKIMRNADLALYQAKDMGGGEHCAYEPSFHRLAEEKRKLEFSLRRAIERDELVLHFQPVVDAHSEEIVSFEALVRWNSAEHGLVSPAKFIPLAEDTRLIVPIGNWVLRQACAEATKWPEHIRVAVNVSGEQLIHPEFTKTVVEALAESGLAASRLEIEVTESIFLRDTDLALAGIEQVMELGCSIALDDFGTGYSSLGYLRSLRFSTIKIDRSFVQGAAENNEECLVIIRAVIAMAESLKISTTAEGVEEPEQAEMMRNMGCKKIQGFHYGRPMPAESVGQVFERYHFPAKRAG